MSLCAEWFGKLRKPNRATAQMPRLSVRASLGPWEMRGEESGKTATLRFEGFQDYELDATTQLVKNYRRRWQAGQ